MRNLTKIQLSLLEGIYSDISNTCHITCINLSSYWFCDDTFPDFSWVSCDSLYLGGVNITNKSLSKFPKKVTTVVDISNTKITDYSKFRKYRNLKHFYCGGTWDIKDKVPKRVTFCYCGWSESGIRELITNQFVSPCNFFGKDRCRTYENRQIDFFNGKIVFK